MCAENAALNADAFADSASVRTAICAFGNKPPSFWDEAEVGSDAQLCSCLMLAADVTYDHAGIAPLCETIAKALLRTPDARVLCAHQHRGLASFLSGRSTLRHLRRAAERSGLQVNELQTEDLFAKVSILEISKAAQVDAANARQPRR